MDGNFFKKLDRFKLPIALSILGIVLIIGGILTSSLMQPKNYPKASLVGNQKINVDVSGAVKKPGVYQLNQDSRVEQAITAAHGFAENANQEYISKYLNLAQKLVDGSKVYVPAEGETFSNVTTSGVAGINTQAKVNVNTASQSELEVLPAVGPVTASKIISERPYQQIEELLSKKIVSKAVFEKIKELVVTY